MSAVIGGQRLGLLAAYEQGAVLDKIAVVSATGDSAVEVASVLCDLSLIVLDVPKLRVPPRTLEGLRARVRNKNAVLVVAGGEQWLRQPQVRLDAFPVAAAGLAMGHGRVRRMIFEVRVLVRERPFRRGRLVLEGTAAGHTGWRAAAAVGVPSLRPVHSQAGWTGAEAVVRVMECAVHPRALPRSGSAAAGAGPIRVGVSSQSGPGRSGRYTHAGSRGGAQRGHRSGGHAPRLAQADFSAPRKEPAVRA
ncbi:hypothetical protein [Nocardia tengchongensis]|uniref:hypothetical protein n=1 Tax=Nocardia tengchongensis TaxID=2055889 RepID=UPI0036B975EA